jgi:hypothetical protein
MYRECNIHVENTTVNQNERAPSCAELAVQSFALYEVSASTW